MAVVGVQPLGPQTVDQIPEKQHLSEVVATVNAIFETVKEPLIYWWDIFMSGAKLAFANTGFFFFRALEFIFPALALRTEGIVLRISNAWQAMRQNRAVGNLLEKIAELELQVQRFSRRSEDRDHLAAECAALREKNLYLQNLQQEAEGVNKYQAEEVQATEKQRDLLFDENTRLKLQIEQLKGQSQEAKDRVDSFNALVQQLQLELQDVKRTDQDYEQEAQLRQTLFCQVQKIVQTCGQGDVHQPTELDHNLNRLLPFLLNQLEQAQNLLPKVKEDLHNESAKIVVRSFERILKQIHLSFSNIPVAFKRHTAWNANIYQLVNHLSRNQEIY